MRRKLDFFNSFPVAAIGVLFFAVPCGAKSFACIGFDTPSSLIFQGDASLTNDRVRLTSAERGQAGGLWSAAKQPIEDGFETSFQFQLTRPGGHGANGLAFVIQNNDTPRLGAGGHGMGFRGIPNSLVIKFDPYHFKDHHYVKYDEVAVLENRSSSIYPPDVGIMDLSTNAVFSDGQIHTVKIIYISGRLEVFLDDLKNPLLTVPVDLANAVALDNGRAWVGLTAATGADFFNQDILSWAFNTPEEIVQNPATASGPSFATQSQNINRLHSTPAISENIAHAVSETPLPTDPAFGYALPADIELTHRIEASSDLIHWVLLTNAVLYFRDPDSTKYDHRYYRFQKK